MNKKQVNKSEEKEIVLYNVNVHFGNSIIPFRIADPMSVVIAFRKRVVYNIFSEQKKADLHIDLSKALMIEVMPHEN